MCVNGCNTIMNFIFWCKLHSVTLLRRRLFYINRQNAKGKSKGSVSQLMDDLDLINSVEQVEAMVKSIQKGVENVLRK